MKNIGILFPHQLFEQHDIHKACDIIYLIEEFLFFRQYAFHKQKIAFHRASMKTYAAYLKTQGIKVEYIDSTNELSDIRSLLPYLVSNEKNIKLHIIDPTDNWLERRIKRCTKQAEIAFYENPQFLNSRQDLKSFFRADKKTFFQTSFYKQQRTIRKILIDTKGQPEGGQWTYDVDNRKKYPKGKTPPKVTYPIADTHWYEACNYVNKHFQENPGSLSEQPLYPTGYKGSQQWLLDFLQNRFSEFGPFEDAIVQKEAILHHSVLSPLLNVGLLSPQHVLNTALTYAQQHNIPINSTEGFVRQLIGWREFIRGMYECKGVASRTTNYWQFNRKIPASFYNGTTGIVPVDDTIKKVLQTGYCHHIERLMILGNFMLLCEFDPKEVYRWFMELFIDAYDWVMVPNVYGMSQFADGGLFATKPYIGGSNYIKKMSDYQNGDWQETWDGLYWHFIDKHQSFFNSNPRLSMMVRILEKMDQNKRITHLKNAQAFFQELEK